MLLWVEMGLAWQLFYRNHAATILNVWTEILDCTDPLIAEASAALLAVQMAKEASFQGFLFFKEALWWSSKLFKVFLQHNIDLLIMLSMTIDLFFFFFFFWYASNVCRDFNFAAHFIAKWILFCKLSREPSSSSLFSPLFLRIEQKVLIPLFLLVYLFSIYKKAFHS